MSTGPVEQPTNINAVANCADLQAKHRAEAAKTPNLRDRYTAADDRFNATQKQREACAKDLAQNNQILQGLDAQIRAIPGCTIPN